MGLQAICVSMNSKKEHRRDLRCEWMNARVTISESGNPSNEYISFKDNEMLEYFYYIKLCIQNGHQCTKL